MFMNTIAVGPFDEVASCVTGGITVAIVRDERGEGCGHTWHKHVVGAVAGLDRNDEGESFGTRGKRFRNDIATGRGSCLEMQDLNYLKFVQFLEKFCALVLRGTSMMRIAGIRVGVCRRAELRVIF